MRVLLACLIMTLLTACASSKERAGPSDLRTLITTMAAYADGQVTTTQLVEGATGASPHSTAATDYKHGAFVSREGYRFTDLDARIRQGDFDAAVFVVLPLERDPCLRIEEVLGLVEGMTRNLQLGIPSPHAPPRPPRRGYERKYAFGTLFAYASGTSEKCVDLISVQRNRPVRLREADSTGTEAAKHPRQLE